ncbi:MAG: septum formation initiator family protein [Pseudomonadota bacterium]
MGLVKTVMLVMLVALAFLQYRLWLSPTGKQELWRVQTEVKTRQQDIQEKTLRNQNLEAEVLDLKEGVKAAEERARGELGMVGNDETFFRVVESDKE